ncbi:MAG TPA: hypothetical protein VNK67_03205 [Burkholderiales bacterium]|nr:hypothetical protein [Burkholderiales bacterium]
MKNTRFDFEFRPKSYFGPMSLEHKIRTSIKGEARRRYAAFLLEREGEAAVDGDVLRESLADDEREAQGRIHPALMGGEYLPDFEPGEVEIVRIVLASTTCDVISVRARRVGNRIGYRVCDEYGEKYTCIPKTSAKPLTLRQLIGLLDNANFEGGLPGASS